MVLVLAPKVSLASDLPSDRVARNTDGADLRTITAKRVATLPLVPANKQLSPQRDVGRKKLKQRLALTHLYKVSEAA